MANNPHIDIFERHNLRTGVTDCSIHIFDDSDETVLIFAEKKDIPTVDLALLEMLMDIVKDDDSLHSGGSRCIIEDIFGRIQLQKLNLTIGEMCYFYHSIEHIMKRIL